MNINRLFLLTGFQIRHDADQFIYRLQSHRGYCQDPEIRENTLAALKKSYELGYQMVEFDVRLTKDHQVVLFHDDHIEGQKISNLNLTELSQIIQVDLLKDVFRWYQTIESSKFKLNIEIKSKVINGSVEFFVYRLIQDFKMQKNILISSFNPFSLFHFYRYDSAIFRSLLLTYEKTVGNNFLIQNMAFNFLAKPNALHLRKEDWVPEVFKSIQRHNIPIVLWTCNDIKNIEKYFSEGISGIISDAIKPADLAIQQVSR